MYAICYEVENSTLQIGSHVLSVSNPLFVKSLNELPISQEILYSINGISIKFTDDPVKFKCFLEKKLEKKEEKKEDKSSTDGVVWTGDLKFRDTAYGTFEKNVPKYGLSEVVINTLTNGSKLFVRVCTNKEDKK